MPQKKDMHAEIARLRMNSLKTVVGCAGVN